MKRIIVLPFKDGDIQDGMRRLIQLTPEAVVVFPVVELPMFTESMIKIIEEIAGVSNLKKNYQLNMPKGVKGRSSNNELAIKILKWNYSKKLKDGLDITYKWIFEQLTSKKSNIEKFQRSNYT